MEWNISVLSSGLSSHYNRYIWQLKVDRLLKYHLFTIPISEMLNNSIWHQADFIAQLEKMHLEKMHIEHKNDSLKSIQWNVLNNY